MQIAITAAKFTPDEADGLRRAMATFRHNGNVHLFRDKFIERHDPAAAMSADFAEHCFSQIEGFGEYGFPESHAASFALLVYASSWIKCHYPDVFCAAILNSQPMGFYQPAQLVRDARQHGVEVREVDVNYSAWDCTLEPRSANGTPCRSPRLPADQRLNEDELEQARRGARQRLCQHRAARGGRRRLALHDRAARRSGCLPLARARPARRAVGRAAARRHRRPPDEADRQAERRGPPAAAARPAHERRAVSGARGCAAADAAAEHVVEDYAATGLSLKAHPVQLLPRPPRAARRHRNAEHRSERLRAGSAGHGRRPGAGPADARHRQGRRLHDARGRDRHRQYHRLAEGVREATAAPS